MSTKIVNDVIRGRVQSGIDQVVDLVRITTGPRGGNVLVDRGYGTPIEANDAATIIKSIVLEDKFENMGVEILKDIISKLKDGRSAAVIFAQMLLREGNKLIAQGWNGSMMRRGIKTAADDVIAELGNIARPIHADQDIMNVASISADSKEYGKIIADTIKALGPDGIITVEESDLFDVEAKMTDGLEFERGYISPWMVTDADRMVTDMMDVPVLVTDKKITDARQLFPLLQKVSKAGNTMMFIIAEDIDGEALQMIIKNKLSGGIQVLGVKIPGFGDMKKEGLSDIALVCGAQVVTDVMGELKDVDANVLGRVHRVIATKETTTLVGGVGSKEKVDERVKQIKVQIEQTKDGFKIEQFEKRIGNLVGKVAVINVGANTETARNHTKLKIDDAVAATKKAIKNGVVSGGGVALVKVKGSVFRNLSNESPEFVMGYMLVVEALDEPFRQIVRNSKPKKGFWKKMFTEDDGERMVRNIIDREFIDYGYDAENDREVNDMYEAGIIDSVEIAQDGIKFAAEAIGMLLTSRGGTAQLKE